MRGDIVNSIREKGFIDVGEKAPEDLKNEIKKLVKEKNAVILAHFYQEDNIQEIADFVGDSLALAQQAAKTKADMILFAGVHFMAETAKLLAQDKKVLLPDLNAGCSLADSCPPDLFKEFIKIHPKHTVISYVNTSTEIKALTDIVCTSTNAVQIINSLPKDEKIIFAPDKNLGNYLKRMSGRDMVIWDGACHVHEEFSLERILDLKNDFPEAKIIVHPECEKPVQIIADHIGSTSSLLRFTKEDSSNTYIVATESGILYQMKKASPEKKFIPAPPKDSTCACNDCVFMKQITLKKMYWTLRYELPKIEIQENLIKEARKPIQKMLDISEQLGL